ncbi:Major Facilitator Superfamily protein [Ensifer adhaerens]|nr:Major Facilitator Superfamily protein [Ensifer adhaerens]
MLSTIRFVAHHPVLRIYGLLMFIASSAGACVLPYRALIAIDTLHMSEQAFAAMMLLSTLTALVFGVCIGIVSDFAGNRRRLMAILLSVGVAAALLIWMVETAWMMALAVICLLPFANINPMIYAGTRMEAASLDPREAASVNSVVRTTMSASWVFIPVAVALVLETGGLGVMNVWAVMACLFGLCLVLVLIFLPDTARAGSAPGGLAGFRAALKELAHPAILLRLVAVSLLSSVNWLNGYVQALIIKTTLGGTLGEAGFMASGIALMEIPFMLAWASALRRLGPVTTLAAGSALYAVYLVGLGLATSVWQVHALIPIAGAGAAAILSVPISYFQDMFPERPGLGTSLYPMQTFLGTGAAAGTFAVATHFTSYQGTAIVGAAITLAASLLLIAIERGVHLPQKGTAG